MSIELTEVSKEIFEKTADHVFSSDEAFSFLESKITVRKFSDVLRSLTDTPDIKETLTNRLLEYDPLLQPDSAAKSVREWLRDARRPTDRETLFKICFALELNEMAANRLLTASEEPQIHYRNPAEAVYAFCLRNRLGYHTAQEMLQQIPLVSADTNGKPGSTQLIRRDFEKVQTKDELFRFLAARKAELGTLHETAYRYFRQMVDTLRNPQTDMDDEDSYSFETVAQEYLRMHVPLSRSSAGLNRLQKTIKKYWPNESTLKKMYARYEDVNRKTLLLLYVVTEGNAESEYDEDLDEDYISAREQFERHFWKVNLLLDECGMGPIDPRNQFDWLILYALRFCCDEDDFSGMSDGMESVLSLVFPDVE